MKHMWVILVHPVEARISLVEIIVRIEKVQVFSSACFERGAFAVKPGPFEGMLGA